MKGNESDDPNAWFAKAEQDRRAAQILMQSAEPVTDMVCYHSQQCAEKYLKGYLKRRQVRFKWVHDLDYLVDLCAESDIDFGSLRTVAIQLTDSAGLSRYPGDEAPATREEAQAAIDAAEEIRGMVLQKVG
jgi:HEPN domain-containing protein